MSTYEIIATIFALLGVFFASKENSLSWPANIVSSSIYVYIFYTSELYYEAGLNIFFIVLGIQGIKRWYFDEESKRNAQIHSVSFREQKFPILICFFISIIFGIISFKFFNSKVAFLDATITVFSVYCTYLTIEKVIENWLLWIIIDIVCVFLYIYKGLYVTVILYCIYLVMATFGYREWQKKL